MKTKKKLSDGNLENQDLLLNESFSSSVIQSSIVVSPELREIQSNLALEGIHIPDERLSRYSDEFERAKVSGAASDVMKRAKELFP